MKTMTLNEFLLARIAEDEAVARDALAAEIYTVEHEHMERWHPARVLAECEAKRGIVELAMSWAQTAEAHPEFRDAGAISIELGYVLRRLAQPYADHPDYREEWKP